MMSKNFNRIDSAEIQGATSNQATQKFYKTRDINLSTGLVLDGHQIVDIEDQDGRGIFVFGNSPKLQTSIKNYYAGNLAFDLRRVFDEWKALKSRTYAVTGCKK